ncbi:MULTISPECIES: YdbC family protein [Fusobacterium]|uniref:YdbC family protein n=1 Tax=Fusobacterium TaxID=848 RepID=UPI0015A5FB6F|nr:MULTISPECIES: PC4/YdbC family ssDNA-binding protein [Fusobacterium]MCF2612973.1 hypothetical protein [Fusobacterium perfoetens]MDY2980109.1 PC4/YdbC family ssDNA-binding protein [Fusobacterium sp.]
MADIKFDIIEKLGTIGEGSKGWSKEVNIISWNGRKPKIDIRDWDENNEKMGKGLTLTKEELKTLKGLLNSLDIDELDI